MTKAVAFCLLAAALAGCSGSKGELATPATSARVLSIAGPGGSVGLGDSLAQAKKAFPAPTGAIAFDKSMSFAILNKDGWAWGQQNTAFEVALTNGKIVALASTLGNSDGEPAKSISTFGQPSRKAEGKSVSMYVWDSGKDARILVCMGAGGLLPNGAITMVGSKTDLAQLNYQADNPAAFVNLMDAGAGQISGQPATGKH